MNEDKVVLVTGSGKRIGAAIVRGFHCRGYRVLIHYNHSREEALALEKLLNEQRAASAETLRADLTSAVDVERLALEAQEAFGRLDVLVNNASSFYPTWFGEVKATDWDDLIDSNLRASFFLSQFLSEEIRRRKGAIINLVDTHADRPLAEHSVYSIAKAGLKAMTKALAEELAPDVRVNGVSPGAILWPQSLEDAEDPEVQARRKAIIKAIPVGRLGDPDGIADAVIFLALDATYVTGQVIKVDGGRSLA